MYIIKRNKKSIKYQANNIEENIMNVQPPSKALINFAWVDSMNSIVWNHEVRSCLWKIEKIKKMVENQRKLWKHVPEEKWQQRVC